MKLTGENVIKLARTNHTWGNQILSMIVEENIPCNMSSSGLGVTGKHGEEGFDHTEAFVRLKEFSEHQIRNENKPGGLYEAPQFYDVFVTMLDSFYVGMNEKCNILPYLAKRIAAKNPGLAKVTKSNKVILPSEHENDIDEDSDA